MRWGTVVDGKTGERGGRWDDGRVGCVADGSGDAEGATRAASAAVVVATRRKGHTAKVILIPLHCIAHSHDSRAVLIVPTVEWSNIEKRNRYRYKNVFFFFCQFRAGAHSFTDKTQRVRACTRSSLSENEFINSRQLSTDVRIGY